MNVGLENRFEGALDKLEWCIHRVASTTTSTLFKTLSNSSNDPSPSKSHSNPSDDAEHWLNKHNNSRIKLGKTTENPRPEIFIGVGV